MENVIEDNILCFHMFLCLPSPPLLGGLLDPGLSVRLSVRLSTISIPR